MLRDINDYLMFGIYFLFYELYMVYMVYGIFRIFVLNMIIVYDFLSYWDLVVCFFVRLIVWILD